MIAKETIRLIAVFLNIIQLILLFGKIYDNVMIGLVMTLEGSGNDRIIDLATLQHPLRRMDSAHELDVFGKGEVER